MRKHTIWTLFLMSATTVACGDDTDDSNPGAGGAGGSGGAASSATVGGGGSGGSVALTQEEKAVALVAAFESGDPAVLDYVSESYIQHNLAFPDGKGVLAGLLTGQPTGFTATTHRVFSDGDIVFMHNSYGGAWNEGTPQVAFDVFRFDSAGRIAEHWDNLADIVDDMDGTTQTDGPTEATDLDQTEANRGVITAALQNLFVDGQWSTIETYVDLQNYVQHSPGFGADATGLQMLLGSLPDGTPFYASVEYIYVEGDFALSLAEGLPDQNTGVVSAYYDLWRLDAGRVVEHWDIIQEIPPESAWANQNGKW